MVKDKLNPQQRKQMQRVLHGALEQMAATLGMMLGDDVQIDQSQAQLRPMGVCVSLGLEGALSGAVYLDIPENMAVDAVKRLNAGVALSLLDETARSVLMELGNVLASVFVAYYDQNRGLRTLPTPPSLSLVPLEIPEFEGLFSAQVRWGGFDDNTELLIGLRQSAIDMLLD